MQSRSDEQSSRCACPSLAELLQVAVDATREAGNEALAYWRDLAHDPELLAKTDGTVVTPMDRRVETLIRERLSQVGGEFGCISEESGADEECCSRKWVIDPIDGTRYFIRHLPFFAVVIGLLYGDVPQLGVVYQPATGQMFHAYHSGGVCLNGRSLKPVRNAELARALVYVDVDGIQRLPTDERAWVEEKLIALTRVCYRVRMFGCAAIAATWYAAGAIDGFVDLTGRNPLWDMVAARVVMTEAGAQEAFVDAGLGARRYLAASPPFFEVFNRILSG